MTPLFLAHRFAAFFAGLPSKWQKIDDKLPSNSSEVLLRIPYERKHVAHREFSNLPPD